MKKNVLSHTSSADERFLSIYGGGENMMAIGDEMNAAGAAVQNKQFVGKTNNYIFTIANTSGAIINDVTFLNAAVNTYLSGNGLASGITISNGYSGDTYQSILSDILDRDMEIVGWDILGSSDTQAEATITFTTRPGRGKGSFDTIVPDRDPKNYQTGRTYSDVPVTITKNTIAVIDSMAANSWMKFKLSIGERTTKTGVVQQFSVNTLAQLPTASK